MKRSLMWLVVGLLGGAILSGTAVAAAYSVAANCTAAPLQFVVGGSPQTPEVAGGGPSGFICHGSAYVPVRWLAQALGQAVSWDGTTHTITLTASGTASAATPTEVVDFAPANFTATETVSGYCWTASVAAPRAGAFRCMAGNAIFDPCFVGTAANTVDCPDPTASPDLQTGTVIKLTKALPAGSTAEPDPTHPWRFELAGGAMCGAMTGTVMPGYPYGCAPVATGSAGAGAPGGGLYCTAPVQDATGPRYTASCAPLSPQPAANGAPQLASPSTYVIAEMWL